MVVFSSLPGGSLGLGAADLGTVLAALALRLRHRQQVTATSTAGAPEGCQTLLAEVPRRASRAAVQQIVMTWAPGPCAHLNVVKPQGKVVGKQLAGHADRSINMTMGQRLMAVWVSPTSRRATPPPTAPPRMAAKWLLPPLGAGTGTVDAGEAVVASGEAGGLQAGQMAWASRCLAFLSVSEVELPTQRITPGSEGCARLLRLRRLLGNICGSSLPMRPPKFSTGMSTPMLALAYLHNTLWLAQPALHQVTWQTDSPETLH